MNKKTIAFLVVILALSVLGAFFVIPVSGLGNEPRPWKLGLDLIGGSHLVYEVDMSAVSSLERDGVMQGLKEVIERRVNLFGVSEPQVFSAKSGDSYRLIVELAGVKDISAAISQIGETPFLEFRELADEASLEQDAFVADAVDGELELSLDQSNLFIPTGLDGQYVEGASLGIDHITGQPVVFLNFSDEGDKLFEDITARNIGKQVAILLDGEVISAPVVQQVISTGGQITGLGGIEEAKLLVQRLNAGALPAPISLISQQTIGASLGSDSLNKIIWAGMVGSILVILFMLIYYRKLGLVASVALLIYIILLLSVFKLFFTLTLASIAGIILSVGVAIDANILIFERAKEELKKGAERAAALREGFTRAWPSIRDSNITSIITALVLFNLTSSFIRGFALSLLIGVLISMFSAITITRNLLEIRTK